MKNLRREPEVFKFLVAVGQAFLPPVESLPNPGEPPLPGLTFLTVPDARNGHTNSVKLSPF
ncbi:hypothetical protein, partial [Brucella melitensis]|uniref:hypothetical protein n=1 Tax=Brucella melitensis TaxID=29459 RepID=UPI0030FF11A1